MRFSMIRAIAAAERRSIRRLARYWVFFSLALLIGSLIYLQYAVMHGLGSHLSATIGLMNPRYLVVSIGTVLLVIFSLSAIFLAFDIRSRDLRDRIAEVLDTHPMTNSELVIGRSAGVVFMSWLPVLAFLVLLQVVGHLANTLGWYVGEPIELYSLLGMATSSLFVLTLWVAIVVSISVVVRHRILVVIVALTLLGLSFWVLSIVPLKFSNLFAFVLGPGFALGSDLVPTFVYPLPGSELWYPMVGLIAASLLAFAITGYPRKDDGAKKSFRIGMGTIFLGAVLWCVQYWLIERGSTMSQAALTVHKADSSKPRVNIEHISGHIIIDPGTRLSVDVVLQVQADDVVDVVRLTFNPGLEIERLELHGNPVEFSHQNGLITIEQDLLMGQKARIHITANGMPDVDFGYLDSAIDPRNVSVTNGQMLMQLGLQNAIYDSSYVALMPGIFWLPAAGSGLSDGDSVAASTDFFTVDLQVSVPNEWLVAGPGVREELEYSDQRRTFRFQPNAPLPEVGLLASHFKRMATSIKGVDVELLLHPTHLRNVTFFSDAVSEITERVAEILERGRRYEMGYPYGAFTVVEVPLNLRGYRGGWRMDTAQSLPGVALVRESGFPTARFEFPFREPEDFQELDGGIGEGKAERLMAFFEADVSGGNVLYHGARNFFQFQTGATGRGALAINFVLDELVNGVITESQGYFSTYQFNQGSQVVFGRVITDMLTGNSGSITEAVMRTAVDRATIWDRLLGTPLSDMQPNDNPEESLNVLAMKSRALARVILDSAGKETVGQFLSTLREQYWGGHFTAEDFERVALESGFSLRHLLGDWLNDTALPGFIIGRVSVKRLRDDDFGRARFQTSVPIRNDEEIAGPIRIRYREAQEKKDSRQEIPWDNTDAMRIEGKTSVEIGLITNRPLGRIIVDPYLSLNRRSVELKVPLVDAENSVDAAPFVGSRESAWIPLTEREGHIIVDDLDDGFRIENDSDVVWNASAGIFMGNVKRQLDQGLPEHEWLFGNPVVWSRMPHPGAWGKYRRTMAFILGAEGDQRAIFQADIPSEGQWYLDYHIPSRRTVEMNVGTARTAKAAGVFVVEVGDGSAPEPRYDVKIVSEFGEEMIEFDADAAEPGWNALGRYRLPVGVVEVVVSNKVDSSRQEEALIRADAIRWRGVK